jgi:hypothetical protein
MSADTPRVTACIEAVMKRFPSDRSTAYFTEVHQHLAPLARDLEREVAAVREAILTYYDALRARQHGDVAQDKAFNAIEQALGLSWQAGVDHRAAPAGETPP